MLFPREYVAYMAKQLLQRLTKSGLIQFDETDYVNEVMTQMMLDELGIEDRINDEVRLMLEKHGDQMKTLGATYEDAFKVIKRQLVRDRKVIL